MKIFVLFAFIGFIGCGDEEISKNDISGRVANASLMMEFRGSQDFTGTGLTLKRLRVWKSRGNSEAGGLYNAIDVFAVEMWYQLEQDKELAAQNSSSGESAEEGAGLLEGTDEEFKYYRYNVVDGLRSTDDGFLYSLSAEPGTTTEEIPSGLGRLQSDGFFSYTRSETDGLIAEKFPAHLVYNELSGEISDSKTTKEIIKANEVADSGWENTFQYSAAGLFESRTRFEQNIDYATKGKLGCLVKPQTDSASYEARTFSFADIELGTTLRDNKGHENASHVDDADTLGDDDELWIQWNENWYLTGLNWQTRKTRLMRQRSAPYYTNRELPGVDSGDSAGKPSGINGLVKSCNDAAKNTGGTWQFLTLTAGASARLQLSGTQQSFCQELKDVSDINSEALNNTDFGCTGFNTGVITGGTFDGSTHSGPISTVSSSLNFQEMSGIVEVRLP